MTHAQLKELSKRKSGKKRIAIDRFLGIDEGSLDVGRLVDCDNVCVLSGGALKSLLSTEEIDVGVSADLTGVYTYLQYYDPRYEKQVSPEFIYANVCPKNVLNYTKNTHLTSRILVSQNGYFGKTEDGYTNVLASFVDDGTIYVLYDAVCTIIDQRRTSVISSVGNGIVALFNSRISEADGTSTYVYNVKQLWLDTIKDKKVTSKLINAVLTKRHTASGNYANCTLVSEDGKTFRYTSADYKPSLGAYYAAYSDDIYEQLYPTIGNAYKPNTTIENKKRQLVRFRNSRESENAKENFVYLPDMLLISGNGSEWSVKETSMPSFDGAVQHFERLFAFKGEKLYASVKGSCTDFTEGVDNLPISAGWQTVTSDKSGFTSIASFDGKVVAFTDKSMMTVKGVDLPFSISYVGAYGCKSPSSIAIYGGQMYFSSHSGILAYNGSSVKCISNCLPKDFVFEDAKLTVSNGFLVVEFPLFKGFYLYNPKSDSWTCQKGEYLSSIMPGGDGGAIVRKSENGYKLYSTFSKESEFEFSFFYDTGIPKRITAVTVTASVVGGSLSLVDKNKKPLIKIEDTGGRVI
ncbi:MAG: hypothetical protein II334_03130, partial [Clostridia bacterium]|nr:hypothetical protein [Clostridia bacterium]